MRVGQISISALPPLDLLITISSAKPPVWYPRSNHFFFAASKRAVSFRYAAAAQSRSRRVHVLFSPTHPYPLTNPAHGGGAKEHVGLARHSESGWRGGSRRGRARHRNQGRARRRCGARGRELPGLRAVSAARAELVVLH
jgi:hypothetical protein